MYDYLLRGTPRATNFTPLRFALTYIRPSIGYGSIIMSSIIAYYRVSTDKQGRSGLGLDAQRKAVLQFVASEALETAGEFIEIETGKGSDALDKRPQLAAALRAAKKLKAPIVVAKLDRLSRDVHFISGLITQRVPFIVAAL